MFSSGAGGWATTLEFKEDGSFSGEYSDTNLGMTGEDYPNGECLTSKFSGKFKDPQKTGDYEYTITLDGDMELENTVGDTEIVEGVKYEYTEPYGIENLSDGNNLRVILPEHDMADMDSYGPWLMITDWYEEGVATCPVHLLINDEKEYVFVEIE